MGRREFTGRVISAKMQKTAVVEIEWVKVHPLYRKSVRHFTKLYAHDPENECRIGDRVRVLEIRPMSKTKRWLLAEVLARPEEVLEVPLEEIVESVTGDTEASVAEATPIENESVNVTVSEEVVEAEGEEPAEAPVAEAAPIENESVNVTVSEEVVEAEGEEPAEAPVAEAAPIENESVNVTVSEEVVEAEGEEPAEASVAEAIPIEVDNPREKDQA